MTFFKSEPERNKMQVNIDLKITEGAVKEFKKALSELGDEGKPQVVRVSVQGGGCSGFMYGLGFVPSEDITADDVVEDYDGLKVAVDKKSLLYLDGTTIDWVEDLSQRGFKFNNPNAKKTCGCNKSFSC
jgi:iron-sulfur cluster assembly protein